MFCVSSLTYFSSTESIFNPLLSNQLIMTEIFQNNVKNSRLIDRINSTNTISNDLLRVLSNLNEFTNTYLTNQLLPLIDELSQNYKKDHNLKVLQNCFQQLCYFLGVDKNQSSLLVNYNQLIAIASQLEKLTPGEEINIKDVKYTEAANGLNNLINIYLILLINSRRSNALIYNTIYYKNQLNYWDGVKDSSINKLIYFIQISPVKIIELGKLILDNFRDMFRTSIEQDLVSEAKLLVNCSQKTISKLLKTAPSFSMYQINTNKFSKLKFIYQTPVNIINKEISAKINLLNDRINLNSEQLGVIINNLPREIPKNIADDFKNLSIYENLQRLDNNASGTVNERVLRLLKEKLIAENTKPSRLVRYWPLILAVLRYGPSNSINLYQNRYAIAHWIKFNFIDAIVGFGKNWVLQPINNMLSILRHDENFNELSIISKDSLKSDLDSLERMVVDYVVDYEHSSDKTALTKQIHEAIQEGNLTMLMSNYEQDLRSPFRSLARGSLVRALLIQLQKTKVDGGVAVSGIDKMLQSQQLVFGVVAISPSLLILYQAYQYMVKESSKPIMVNGKQLNMVCLKSLNRIEKLISQPQSPLNTGELFVEIVNLQIHSCLIMPKQLRKDWNQDLNELNRVDVDKDTKLAVIARIWNMYSCYFR